MENMENGEAKGKPMGAVSVFTVGNYPNQPLAKRWPLPLTEVSVTLASRRRRPSVQRSLKARVVGSARRLW